ncbi:hexosyltransferase [Plakobranchus ocellatus]|uniref:Hexosyltransferase n=1 Tax=Plakobranchus ocellatus TaxID=259542 RepID=A0AAV3ZLB2_9GAST|nr:hexosyltransferase [Plakobranchus ocellatus]
MKVEISNGELILSVYIFLPLLSTLVAVYSIASYSIIVETPDDLLCISQEDDLFLEKLNQWKPNKACLSCDILKQASHPGCSREPVYTSRDSCPTCFRPEVLRNFSEDLFMTVSDPIYLFPRGPPGFFQPKISRQQELVTTALVTPIDMCVHTCPYLVVLVLSMQHEQNTRDSIRKTWASVSKTNHWPGQGKLNAQVGVVFVLAWNRDDTAAERKKTVNLLEKIYEEAANYNDVLFLDMIDDYSNLTLKVASAFSWALQHCRTTKFFMKIDQDTFLNVPLLLDLLIYHERRLQRSVTGHIYIRERKVQRVGRWGVNKTKFPMNDYPVYAAGKEIYL